MDTLIIQQHIEALIFVSETAISFKEIKLSLEKSLGVELDKNVLENILEGIEKKYESPDFVFQLHTISNGYQFLSKSDYHKTISSYLNIKSKRRLSNAALETLSIIAYKQPVTKGEIEGIRGVSCDYSIQKLLEKELVEITGRSEAVGRPLLYGTSRLFMNYFGLKSIKDLPKLKEIIPQHNEIGASEQEKKQPLEQQRQTILGEEKTPPQTLQESSEELKGAEEKHEDGIPPQSAKV